MKYTFFFLIILFLLTSCSIQNKSKQTLPQKIQKTELQHLLNKNNVGGAILIFDAQHHKYYSNDFYEASKKYLPASTFKIPNTIIGLELNILKNENTIFKWNGEKRYFDFWEKDLTVKEAFQKSCVPCYQELAKKIGVSKMKHFLRKLQFGNMIVNDKNLDDFWLKGASNINPLQQIDFLSRFYQKKLPTSNHTFKTLKKILKINQTKNYTLSGKTGLAVVHKKDIGWFVGYLEKNKKVYYFAIRATPKDGLQREQFIPLRKELVLLAFRELKIID